MTIRSFFFITLLQWIFFTILKVYFLKYSLFGNVGLQILVFWGLVMVLSAAMVRRLGIINFFESVFIILVWVVGGMLVDLIVTSVYTTTQIFRNFPLWTAYGLEAFAIFAFHKKRHIIIRHEQHAHHAGHGHGHGKHH